MRKREAYSPSAPRLPAAPRGPAGQGPSGPRRVRLDGPRRARLAGPRRARLAGALILCLLAAAPAASLEPPRAPAPRAGWPLGEAGVRIAGSEAAPAGFPSSAPFRDRAVILCWHSFLGDPSLPTDFSLAELKAQLDALAALGYRFPSFAEAVSGRLEGPLNVVVTLDDGHRTVPAAVERVFSELGIKPSLFVYPSVIGTQAFAMDDAALGRLSSEGCLVGAHGYHHLFVTADLARRDRAAFDREIHKAKEKTEAITRLPVVAYAYPFGALSQVTKEELVRAGYAYGLAVAPGFVYADEAFDDLLELPRLVVTREGWKDILALLSRNARAFR
ncbi:MAG TPA: polysaccharide deacetylase family protein [Spirochaetales bacterium]|nr:polysaccharide deacetylase family protein [Spirochaetales bacterium]